VLLDTLRQGRLHGEFVRVQKPRRHRRGSVFPGYFLRASLMPPAAF
jgi:hypothetical protein